MLNRSKTLVINYVEICAVIKVTIDNYETLHIISRKKIIDLFHHNLKLKEKKIVIKKKRKIPKNLPKIYEFVGPKSTAK